MKSLPCSIRGFRAEDGTNWFNLLFYLTALFTVSLLYVLFYADVPIYGDAWGYGYNCANWIANNGLPLIPSGTGRGETAGGHTAFYFWMWAVLIRVFGNSVKVAHLLPAVFSYLAIAGTYRLGREISGKALAVTSSIALLASPLFLAQSFRALPIAAAMAAAVWSIFFYSKGRYLTASLFCVFAVMMREQALLLAVSYIAVELYFYNDLKWRRLLILFLPLLVPVINSVSNQIVNGFLFLDINRPGIDSGFSLGLFLERMKHFSHFLTGDFRWIPAGLSIWLLYRRMNLSKAGILLGTALLIFGSMQRFQNYFMVVLCLALLYLLVFRRSRIGRTYLVLVMFPILMVLSFTGIVFVTSTTMQYLFFRYLMSAFPALIVVLLYMFFESRKTFIATAAVFVVATSLMNFTVRDRVNFTDTTLAGYYLPLRVMQEAGTWALEQDLPVISTGGAVNHLEDPALGYAEESVNILNVNGTIGDLPHQDIAIIVPPLLPWGDPGDHHLNMIMQTIGDDYSLELIETISGGPFEAHCYILSPDR